MSEKVARLLLGLCVAIIAVPATMILTGYMPPSGPAPAIRERLFCLLVGVVCGLMLAIMVGTMLFPKADEHDADCPHNKRNTVWGYREWFPPCTCGWPPKADEKLEEPKSERRP